MSEELMKERLAKITAEMAANITKDLVKEITETEIIKQIDKLGKGIILTNDILFGLLWTLVDSGVVTMNDVMKTVTDIQEGKRERY